jgi:exodeoxyribonuclease VII large subunit
MQGEGVEQSIINALERIDNYQLSIVNYQFDAVVIIRGGGATSDMSGFDTLLLAENVANFPLPIITGIGHDRDESILDMVSHQRVKTPTAAAAFLIDHAQRCLDAIDDAQTRMTRYALQRLADHKSQISNLKSQIRGLFSIVKTRQEARLDALHNRMLTRMQQQTTTARATLNLLESKLPLMAERRLQAEHHRIALIEERLKALDPQLLLSRGYSITTKDGRAVRDPSQLKPGDQIETRLEKGTIKSTVI